MHVMSCFLFLYLVFGAGAQDRVSTSNHDENFFDLLQKDIKDKTIEFDRFSGLNTIVAPSIFKQGQNCQEVRNILKEFLQLNYLSPISMAFVIVPDSTELYFTCSDVVKEIFGSKKVNFVVMKPFQKGEEYAIFDYFSKVYGEEFEDETYFIVEPDGDVEIHVVASPIEMMEPLKKVIKKMNRSAKLSAFNSYNSGYDDL